MNRKGKAVNFKLRNKVKKDIFLRVTSVGQRRSGACHSRAEFEVLGL